VPRWWLPPPLVARKLATRQLNDNFMLNVDFFLKDNLMLYNELL